ncbi:MAG: ribonuclease H-like domain-containing protein [Candidatus Micrarchaeota archaeon]
MLDNTFIHLPNFGPNRERKLWYSGVKNWDDFLERFGESTYHQGQCRTVASSRHALKSNDAQYFAEALPRNEAWRCFPHFSRTAYLDIETTGLSAESNDLTVVGIYDGENTKSYIDGQNLDELYKDVKKFDMVVTFNGSLFDVPFLKKSMRGIEIPKLHVDLRFVLSSLNIRGGLKNIERQFGLEREGDLRGLTGYDAVLLWQRYKKRNDKAALDKLVRYNAADISNLKMLLDWAYKEKRKETGFDNYRKN